MLDDIFADSNGPGGYKEPGYLVSFYRRRRFWLFGRRAWFWTIRYGEEVLARSLVWFPTLDHAVEQVRQLELALEGPWIANQPRTEGSGETSPSPAQ